MICDFIPFSPPTRSQYRLERKKKKKQPQSGAGSRDQRGVNPAKQKCLHVSGIRGNRGATLQKLIVVTARSHRPLLLRPGWKKPDVTSLNVKSHKHTNTLTHKHTPTSRWPRWPARRRRRTQAVLSSCKHLQRIQAERIKNKISI